MRTPKQELTHTTTTAPQRTLASRIGAASISTGSAGGGDSGPEEALLMGGDVCPCANVDVLVMSGLV